MQTGKVEANLQILNSEFRLPLVDELISLKVNQSEQTILPSSLAGDLTAAYQGLLSQLAEAGERSNLPEESSARNHLHDLLIRLRRLL